MTKNQLFQEFFLYLQLRRDIGYRLQKDHKDCAKRLKKILNNLGFPIKYSQCIEAISRYNHAVNWHVLSAWMKTSEWNMENLEIPEDLENPKCPEELEEYYNDLISQAELKRLCFKE